MRNQEPKRDRISRIRDWKIVLFYTLFLYISLPFAPRVWQRLARYSDNFPNYFTIAILLIFGLFIVSYLIFQQKGIQSFLWLIILAAFYVIGLKSLKFPAEKIHFLEYGLLSFFVFRALRHDLKNRLIYLWSAIVVFCLGFIDEGIQYLLPNRVYDTRDVFVNALAGILGLLVIGLCFKPKLENSK